MEKQNDLGAIVLDEAQRLEWEEKGEKAVAYALTRLVLGREPIYPFMATLAFRIAAKGSRIPRWDIPTAGTDGKHMFYNPKFFAELSKPESIGVVCHEVFHIVFDFFGRLGARNLKKYNVAQDLVINQMEEEAGLKLPSFRLMPGEGPYDYLPKGLGSDEYYPLIKDLPGGWDAAPADLGGCGVALPAGAGSPAEQKEMAEEWKMAVAQAHAVAKMRGDLPAWIDRLVGDLLESKVPWEDELREFVSQIAKNDYSFSRPNRRHAHNGLYLPSLRSEELGAGVVLIDASGSCYDEQTQGRFLGEIQCVGDLYPDTELTIVFHDTKVHKFYQWKGSDGPIPRGVAGGGGTDHRPAFDWIKANVPEPAWVICLTDLETVFPDQDPGYPVLWLVVGQNKAKPPFGRCVEVRE